MARFGMVALVAGGLALGGCAQGSQPGDLATGSILPALPALPSASSLIPSAGSLVPSWGTSSRPRAPERISGNLYRVYAGDRQIEDSIQRENYALLRAAESTKQVGATHFVVVNAPEGLPQQPTPPSSALIRVLQLETGAEPPVGAIAAEEIIHFFGPAFAAPPKQEAAPSAQKT